MSEFAPAAIRGLFDQIKAAYPSAILSGIVGDQAHTYGYHRGRDFISSGDYSVGDWPQDRNGSGQAACGLDISWGNAGDHYTVSQRLLDLGAGGDGRMDSIREFYGSTNGWDVCGYDFSGNFFTTSDDSHLWHIHISIHRQWSEDVNAMNSVAQAITGGSGGTTPTPTPPPSGGSSPHAGRPWPSYMPHNEWFGDINGPNASHGGYYANEKPDVKAIQEQLLAKGYVPGLGYPNGWADGLFEGPTIDAVTRFQHAEMPGTTYYGQVWSDDWAQLFR